MLRGPIEYVPPASVEVVLKRQAIPLDENEGIYVRDIKTGKVCVCAWVGLMVGVPSQTLCPPGASSDRPHVHADPG